MMMRWSEFAFITALVGGLSYCVACGGKPEQYVIYCVGNLFALFSLLIIKKVGKETVRNNTLYLVLISISTYLFITIGRWLVSLIFEPTFKTIMAFITTDIISLVVLIVGVISLRKSDGILEDQKAYLLRLDREKRQLEEDRFAMASAAYRPNEDEDDEDDFEYPDEETPSDHYYEDDEPDLPEESFEPEDVPVPEIPETEYLPDAGEMPVYSPDEEITPDNDYKNDEFNSEDKI